MCFLFLRLVVECWSSSSSMLIVAVSDGAMDGRKMTVWMICCGAFPCVNVCYFQLNRLFVISILETLNAYPIPLNITSPAPSHPIPHHYRPHHPMMLLQQIDPQCTTTKSTMKSPFVWPLDCMQRSETHRIAKTTDQTARNTYVLSATNTEWDQYIAIFVRPSLVNRIDFGIKRWIFGVIGHWVL